MRLIRVLGEVCLVVLVSTMSMLAQQSSPEPELAGAEPVAKATPLRLIRFSGVLRDALGQPSRSGGTVGVTFALYTEQEGGAPLWLETQNVEAGPEGRYTVLLGATQSEGLPLEIFTSEEARWLGVQVQGEKEQPRILLVSVPYALKAADAERLGGKPASAFVSIETTESGATGGGEASTLSTGETGTQFVTAGTANFIGKFINSTDLGNSTIFEDPVSFNLGAGTTSPLGKLHVQKTGALTELVVGNPSVVANNAADGALRLYGEQNGVVRKVTIVNTGCCLQFQGAADNVNIQFYPKTEVSFYNGATLGVYDYANAKRLYIRHEGSRALLATYGAGAGGITFRPAADLRTAFQFIRSSAGGGTPILSIDSLNSRVGIGTASPTEKLDVAGTIKATAFVGNASGLSGIATEAELDAETLARVAGDDALSASLDAKVSKSGDTMSGTLTLPANGLVAGTNQLALSGGNVGIGTNAPADPLHVNGIVRLESVNDLSGNCILNCPSDARLKKDIQPLGPVLERLGQLEAVRFDYRAEEYPELHLDTTRHTGLIAQQVQQALPELAGVRQDGFKTVKYHELPVLLLQALRELKSEKDSLQERVGALQQQLAAQAAELARLKEQVERLAALLAASPLVERAAAGSPE